MKWLLHIVVLISAICRLEAKRDFIVDLLEGNITVLDSDYSESFNYHIYNHKTIFVDFILKKNISDFEIALRASLMKKDSRKTTFLTFKLNGCQALKGVLKANLLKIIYSQFRRVTNIDKCPLVVDKLYYVKNFTVNEDQLPIVVPMVEWQLEGDFITDNAVKTKGILLGRVRKL